MKRWILLIAIVLTLTGCQSSIPTEGPEGHDDKPHPIGKEREKVGFVEHVDGDTSKFKINGKVETVRYLLVDTPETRHPELGEQPLGKEASNFVKRNLEKADTITLEYDVEKRDKYGRVLAYVYADGKSVQEGLLKNGLARVGYIYESRRHLEEFRKAEDVAQEKKIGIWQCPGYVTDDGYNPDKWCKDEKPGEGNKGKFIASKNSNIYHEVGCPGGADQIKPENAVYFDSEAEAKASGRRMCHFKECPLH
jgi:micrococcal nuclease